VNSKEENSSKNSASEESFVYLCIVLEHPPYSVRALDMVNGFCLGHVYYTAYTVHRYIKAFMGGGGQIDMIRQNNRALFIIITLTDGQTDGLDSASDRQHCVDRRLGMCSRGGSFSQKIETANTRSAKLSGQTPGVSYCSVESAVSPR
jgi:hypothetical protein